MSMANTAGSLDPIGGDHLAAGMLPGSPLMMAHAPENAQQQTALPEKAGVPTSMEEVKTAKEWLQYVQYLKQKKKSTEESREEDKEKPKFADDCVDYPRDPPRDDVKCCDSKLHETLQRVEIAKKYQAKEAVVTLTKEEQLAQ